VRTIFLDRDGVINENRTDHVKSWGEFRFLPGALAALRLLTELDYRIFVVTNQAVINRGVVSQADIEAIHQQLVLAANNVGASISAIRFCPHRPDERCLCRKPQPGLILGLADEYALDLGKSVLVGDTLSDIAAARAAGCATTMLVRTGLGSEQLALPQATTTQPDLIVDDLYEAAMWLRKRD
jgi:D-glycero-D-manno-heptose 1,7-bisphosphate phosphatase